MATEQNIPLDVKLWLSSAARHGFHPYGPSYLSTFPMEMRPFAIGKPLGECFRIPCTSVQEEMRSKLGHKLHSTRVRAHFFSARHAAHPDSIDRWLASSWGRIVRPMRVYVTIGRRLLWWQNGSLPDDGRDSVTGAFLAEQAFARLHAGF
ncbi:hypothetical protein FJZ48_02655, partial [Candidatus Uhrbacteria bacterium]|nr:hypothetical protein [Candidatus Uhrbacteria bacterium]